MNGRSILWSECYSVTSESMSVGMATPHPVSRKTFVYPQDFTKVLHKRHSTRLGIDMGLGPLFSGAGDSVGQVSTHESKTKNYFCSTSRLVAAACLTLPQRIKQEQQQQRSRKLGHNRSNCNSL